MISAKLSLHRRDQFNSTNQIEFFSSLCTQFCGFTKAFKNFAKYIIGLSLRNLNISRNKLYIWNLQITCFKMIHDMFVFQEFEIFSNFQKWPKFRLLRENCS